MRKPPRVCGIPVAFDPDTLHAARSRFVWPFKTIVLGPRWFMLPLAERTAILFHEARHCLGFHTEIRLLLLPFLLFAPEWVSRIARAQEIECDRFAASRGYGDALASYLARHRAGESMFYPSTEERLRALTEEVQPC